MGSIIGSQNVMGSDYGSKISNTPERKKKKKKKETFFWNSVHT